MDHKQLLRAELQRQVAEYLQRGGKITFVPCGVLGRKRITLTQNDRRNLSKLAKP